MRPDYTHREGVTSSIVFQLLEEDPDTYVRTAVDITGYTKVTLYFRTGDGSPVSNFDTSGSQLSVTDAANGEVTFYPGASDFSASEKWYNLYFIVRDASGKDTSFPSGRNFKFQVIGKFA